MADKKTVVAPASLLVAFSVALSLLVNPIADAAPKKTLKLLWSDEFNSKKGTMPSSKTWSAEIGGGGWGNSERQYYTDKSSNASMDGSGRLVLTANRISNEYSEQVGDVPGTEDILNRCSECQFTSARLKTARKLSFQYGRIEARMKLPQGVGTWPAFWMLGGDLLDGVPWPECGEIDIMEFRGDISDQSTSAIHGPTTPQGSGLGTRFLSFAPLSDEFHTFAIEWKKNSLSFIVDGRVTGTFSSADTGSRGWVYNQKFFLILNLAMGGTYAGEFIDPTLNQAQLSVDYIRFYSVNGVGKVIKG
ncbi:glycoside hydrolase family 16 protein [Polynucleobacter sp.]|uniref:glycoside hydrolase family 16 protein n=1 Tax=Polynucleobacter sp. TaxID=2029855 RepID=UPI00333FA5C5